MARVYGSFYQRKGRTSNVTVRYTVQVPGVYIQIAGSNGGGVKVGHDVDEQYSC